MIRSYGCPYPDESMPANPLIVCDVTLREGEQMPGVAFSLKEKQCLAQKLDDIGVDQIQLPLPRKDSRLINEVKQICALGLRSKTEVMTSAKQDDWKEQIDIAENVGADILHSSFGVGAFTATAWTREKQCDLEEKIDSVVRYMHSTGMQVNISFTDATRADLNLLLGCVKTAVDAGAHRIRFADSFGITGPESWTRLITSASALTKPKGVLLGAHCHNDLGLALADALACIRAGTDIIDVSVNGIGDRAGNVCLEQLAVAMEVLYKRPTHILPEKLTELCRYVSEISGIPIPVNKPLIGANAFVEETAGHAIEQFEFPVEGRAICPEDFGGKLGVVYGKMTNERVIELTAQRAGRHIPSEMIPRLLASLAEYSERQKGLCIYENEFWAIVDSLK